jgi:hypothetical protein
MGDSELELVKRGIDFRLAPLFTRGTKKGLPIGQQPC